MPLVIKKRYALEEALQKHGLPNSRKRNIATASYYVQHLKSLHHRLRLLMSRNLRDSPGFLEFVPGPGTLTTEYHEDTSEYYVHSSRSVSYIPLLNSEYIFGSPG